MGRQRPQDLQIQVLDGNHQPLPLSDPVYGQVYYSDEDGDLLTGLIPEDGSSYMRVSPFAGAYPNDGSTSSNTRPPTNGTVGGRFGYLSTTSTVEQQVIAHVGGSNLASDPTIVDALNFAASVPKGSQVGPGFYVTGCTGDYPGTLELRIGLQLTTTAQTARTSLPLQQVAGQPEHIVAARSLNVNNGEVTLSTTSGFQPADTIDTWLITHGTQIPGGAVEVGGGN